jgi:purine-nucleoside phosphorylase
MLSMLHHIASLYHSATHLHHSWQDAHWEMNTSVFNRAVETVEHLRLKLPDHLSKPRFAIVCGSGLGGLQDIVNKDDVDAKEGKTTWEYKDVPNFPLSTGMEVARSIRFGREKTIVNNMDTVAGHEGKLIFATLGPRRVPVVLLVGRAQCVTPSIDIDSQPIQYQPHPLLQPVLTSLLIFAVSTKATRWLR